MKKISEDYNEFVISRQNHFEQVMFSRLFRDTLYTTKQISYVYSWKDDYNMTLKKLRIALFKMTQKAGFGHIQVERLHFWYIGKPILGMFICCGKCHNYVYEQNHNLECKA